MPADALEVKFVEYMPADLLEAWLYVSIRYRMTAHLCFCGCGEKVINPLRPERWALTYDGSTISLAPSIGNGGLPCRSHYWVIHNHVRWLPPLTQQQVAHALRRDGWAPKPLPAAAGEVPERPRRNARERWYRRVARRLLRRG